MGHKRLNSNYWREIYDGGTPEAEKILFERLARDIQRIQVKTAARARSAPARTLHAKLLAGITNGRLIIDSRLPARFTAGYFRPGRELPVAIRFSNASGFRRSDRDADMRGVALKLNPGLPDCHDLLMTSFPVSHARNARQFVDIARIASGPKVLILPRFLLNLGLAETRRVLWNIRTGSQSTQSLALQGFWSRAPLLWGDAGPVRYQLEPVARGQSVLTPGQDINHLTNELAARLRVGDVTYRLLLQPFVSEELTPIEDGAVEWKTDVSVPVEVATLLIPKQDLSTSAAEAARSAVDDLVFNPWHCPEPFRPLGNLNRARQVVYALSAQGWVKPSKRDSPY